MAVSNAVGSERVSRIVGYQVLKGNFQETTPNLPMRIAVFGQANTTSQTGLTNAPREVTSEAEAGQLYGFGSQIHSIMRILRARTGDRVGGIPTIVYPQVAAGGAAAQVDTITITGGPASAPATHLIRINGRTTIDGDSLSISIASGDAVAAVATKIADAVNACVSCPVSASAALGVVTLTTKWADASAGDLTLAVDTQDNAVGLSYAVAEVTPAAGDSSANITSSLNLFSENWNTIVINPYGKSVVALFEAANGVPGATTPTGRYDPLVFKPFVALTGDRVFDTVANVTASLDQDEGTIVQCPAPNSEGWPFEAAANVAALLSRQAQDSPHRDVSGQAYPDMPVPVDENIGVYSTYNNRDLIVKSGGSTVTLRNSRYIIEDLVTTYHPVGENPPQFRYVRSLMQDWNVRFSYFLLEQINVVDRTILEDGQPTTQQGTIKPKQWRAILRQMFADLALRAIIADTDFSNESLQVAISTINPDRFETFFRYKRTGIARIASTTAEAGFNFGEAVVVA